MKNRCGIWCPNIGNQHKCLLYGPENSDHRNVVLGSMVFHFANTITSFSEFRHMCIYGLP